MDISVVIAALNAADTIEDQLRALASQVFAGDFEVLVVDNGSTDRTRAVVEHFAQHDPRVVLVDGSAVRGSPGAARNIGVELARGDRLAFCDADDIVRPGWLAALHCALDDAGAARGRIEQHSLNPHIDHRFLAEFLADYTVFGYPGFPGGNSALLRSVHAALGGFRDDYPQGQDSEFAVRLAQAGFSVAYVPDAVVSVRLRRGFVPSFRHARRRYAALRRIRVAFDIPVAPGTAVKVARSARSLLRRLTFLFDARQRIVWALRAGEMVGVARNLADVPRTLYRRRNRR